MRLGRLTFAIACAALLAGLAAQPAFHRQRNVIPWRGRFELGRGRNRSLHRAHLQQSRSRIPAQSTGDLRGAEKKEPLPEEKATGAGWLACRRNGWTGFEIFRRKSKSAL